MNNTLPTLLLFLIACADDVILVVPDNDSVEFMESRLDAVNDIFQENGSEITVEISDKGHARIILLGAGTDGIQITAHACGSRIVVTPQISNRNMAQKFGHLAGLLHTQQRNNLMSNDPTTASTTLWQSQIDNMHSTLESLPRCVKGEQVTEAI